MAAVLYFGFQVGTSKTELTTPSVPETKEKEIEIDFGIFETEAFQDLQIPEEIPDLEEGLEVGRENPFIPYTATKEK